MLKFNGFSDQKELLCETNEKYDRNIDEEILSIKGIYDYDDESLEITNGDKPFRKNQLYPGEQYCGVSIFTKNRVISAFISPDRQCCERFGSILSEDDLSKFIGSRLKRIYLTNTCCKTEYIDYILSLKSSSTEQYSIQFINFETNKGFFQLTVYNADNGYYGHDIIIKIDDRIEFKKEITGGGWGGSYIENDDCNA